MDAMPEGDTVWNTARMIDKALAGATVERSDFRVPTLATVDLAGWRVHGCTSRGKHLLLRFTHAIGNQTTAMRTEGRLTLRSHLRMDGSWRIYPPGRAWRGPGHTIRVVLRTPAGTAVGYHLHDLALVPSVDEGRLVGHLGPDLLGEPATPGGWDPDEAVRRLRLRPDRALGEALLDQTCLAGIGNLYRAEILFLRGIHPTTAVGAVDDLDAVVDLARRLLVANRGRWTQASTGSLRRGEEVYVYGRSGAPCRRCDTPIKRDGSQDRVVFWCPACQPSPS